MYIQYNWILWIGVVVVTFAVIILTGLVLQWPGDLVIYSAFGLSPIVASYPMLELSVKRKLRYAALILTAAFFIYFFLVLER